MSWMVKRIQEDDFGCEERPDDERTQVLVTLAAGRRLWIPQLVRFGTSDLYACRFGCAVCRL